jgi:hypothetical protein
MMMMVLMMTMLVLVLGVPPLARVWVRLGLRWGAQRRRRAPRVLEEIP